MTIAALLEKIDELLNKLENIHQFTDQSISITDINIDDDEVEDMLIGSKVKVLIQDIDQIKWRQDLEEDKQKLEKLLVEAATVKPCRDAKLLELKSIIHHKVTNPINPNNKKIIVFTAFADTASYLYNELSEWMLNEYRLHTALVTEQVGIKQRLAIFLKI